MAEHLMNAAISIEALRSVLSREGQDKVSDALRGLEFMDNEAACFALDLLNATPVYGPLAQAAKDEAIRALALATREPATA